MADNGPTQGFSAYAHRAASVGPISRNRGATTPIRSRGGGDPAVTLPAPSVTKYLMCGWDVDVVPRVPVTWPVVDDPDLTGAQCPPGKKAGPSPLDKIHIAAVWEVK